MLMLISVVNRVICGAREMNEMNGKQFIIVTLILVSNVAIADVSKDNPQPVPVSVQGSWAGIKLVNQLIRQYEYEQGSRSFAFGPRDSDQVPGALKKHECNVGMMLDSLAPKLDKDFDNRFEPFPIGRLVVHVAVNAKNSMRTITTEDLRKIFSGQITSWNDVSNGGTLGKIELYGPMLVSTECSIFQKRVMQKSSFAPAFRDSSSKITRQKLSTAEIIGAIGKQTRAIGFFLQADEKELDKRVRILRIAKDKNSPAIAPSIAAVSDGSYQLWDTLTLYLHPDAPPVAREFCKFASGEKALKITRQFEMWPEYQLENPRGKQNVAEVKRGKAETVSIHDLTGNARLLNDLAGDFMKVKTAVQLNVRVNGEAQASLTPEEIEKKLSVDGVELLLVDSEQKTRSGEYVPLGQTAVGVIVHPKNILNALPQKELRGIFGGEIVQWPEADGAAAVMHVHGLFYPDPISQLLKKKIEGELKMSLKYDALPDSKKIISEVARDQTAIGFVDLSQLSPDEKTVKLIDVYLPGRQPPKEVAKDTPRPSKAEAKAPDPKPTLLVQNTSPMAAYSLPQEYPLARTFTLYVSPKASELAKEFAQFLASEHCLKTLNRYSMISPWQAKSLEVSHGTAAVRNPSVESGNLYLGNKP